jgi:hypothetical protein
MTVQRISHKERKAKRTNAINNAMNYVMNAGRTVKVNDIYDHIGNGVFNSQQYFIRCFIDAVKTDDRFKMETARKIGTFICTVDQELVIPKTAKEIEAARPKRKYTKRQATQVSEIRKVTMKGLFGQQPLDFVGTVVQIEIDEKTWTRCKNIPKFIGGTYTDTIEVYRRQELNQPAEYIQVTNNKQFLYKAA